MRFDADRARRRVGFGMLEIVILLAVLAVVGTLIIKVVSQANRMQNIQETWTILERTRLALYNAAGTPPAFEQDVGVNAGKLSQLTRPITTNDSTACSTGNKQLYKNGDVNGWNGPYGGFTVDSTVGLVTPIAIGKNRLVRSPTGGGSGSLGIVFANVDSADVVLLDDMFDDGSSTTGVIRWTTPIVNQLTTMTYLIAVTTGGC